MKIYFCVKNLPNNNADVNQFNFNVVDKTGKVWNTYPQFIEEYFSVSGPTNLMVEGEYTLLSKNTAKLVVDRSKAPFNDTSLKMTHKNCVYIVDDRYDNTNIVYRIVDWELVGKRTISYILKRDVFLTDFPFIVYGADNLVQTSITNTTAFIKREHINRYYKKSMPIGNPMQLIITETDLAKLEPAFKGYCIKQIDAKGITDIALTNNLKNINVNFIQSNGEVIPTTYIIGANTKPYICWKIGTYNVVGVEVSISFNGIDIGENTNLFDNYVQLNTWIDPLTEVPDTGFLNLQLGIKPPPTDEYGFFNSGPFAYGIYGNEVGTTIKQTNDSWDWLLALIGINNTHLLDTGLTIGINTNFSNTKIYGTGGTFVDLLINETPQDVLHFDFKEKSNLFNNDKSLSSITADKPLLKPLQLRRYSNSDFIEELLPFDGKYLYAILSANAVFNNDASKNKPQYDDSYSVIKTPCYIIPLYDGQTFKLNNKNNYQNIIRAGNEAILKIFYSDFNLIGKGVDTPQYAITLTNDEFDGLEGIVCFNLEVVYDFWVRTFNYNDTPSSKETILDNLWFETIKNYMLGFKNYIVKNGLQLETPLNNDYEPKNFMYPHFSMEIQYAKSVREIRNELLWLYDENDIEILVRYIIDINQITKFGFINNGMYKNSNNIEDSAYMMSGSCDIQNTSNAETNYFQNNKNSYNTSKWAYQQNEELGMARGVMGIAAGAGMITLGAMTNNVYAAAGGWGMLGNGIMGMANAAVQNEISNRTLDAQVADAGRKPFSISGAGNDDFINLLMCNKYLANVVNWNFSPQTYINIKSCLEQHKSIITNRYNMFGYMIEKNVVINNGYIGKNRLWFNYYEITNFQNCVDRNSIPPFALEEIADALSKGVRFWNYYTDKRTDLPPELKNIKNRFNDYNNENWEREFFIESIA